VREREREEEWERVQGRRVCLRMWKSMGQSEQERNTDRERDRGRKREGDEERGRRRTRVCTKCQREWGKVSKKEVKWVSRRRELNTHIYTHKERGKVEKREKWRERESERGRKKSMYKNVKEHGAKWARKEDKRGWQKR
jgi:hypothetical protein